MSYSYTTIDGQRVEVNVAVAIRKLAAAFKAKFGLDLLVTSGTRTSAEQQALYNGWIKRLPGYNLAAAPGYSNHEESGPIGPRALDVRDSGSDAGVTVYGSVRAKWLRANASKYGFDPAGYNPNWSQIEPWHIEFSGRIGGRAPEKSQLSPGLEWPFAWHTVVRGETMHTIADHYKISFKRAMNLNPSVKYPTDLKVGARVKVALDQLPIKVAEDGILGPDTWGRWQQSAGQPVTRTGTRDFVRYLQRFLNRHRKSSEQLVVDGIMGPATIRAIQVYVASPGAKDGITSTPSAWVRKLQRQFIKGWDKWQ